MGANYGKLEYLLDASAGTLGYNAGAVTLELGYCLDISVLLGYQRQKDAGSSWSNARCLTQAC